MLVDGHAYRSIWLAEDGRAVEIVDQTLLPHRFETRRLETLDDACEAIRVMRVRGAPLIGATAAYGMALAMADDASDARLDDAYAALFATRPTAVNLRWALDDMAARLRPLPATERAAAAYARQADIKCLVFMPEDTPVANQHETQSYGASAFLVNGLINDCGKIAAAAQEKLNCFDLSTLKEPYRIEGKKTMGLELALQFDWKLPDVILYPTGGGTGLIGMWKAFKELRELGWLKSDIMPKMVAVQSDGCCPIVNAFKNGERFARTFENAKTIAWGIRVPAAIGDFMILEAIKESHGTAIAVDEKMIDEWTKISSEKTGLSICPETAACVGALEQLKNQHWIQADDRVMIFNTASGQKYKDSKKVELPKINIHEEIDWQMIAASL